MVRIGKMVFGKMAGIADVLSLRAMLLFLVIIASLFAPVQPVTAEDGGQERVLVATNRYVILDDFYASAILGQGFSSPAQAATTWNYWNGNGKNLSTEINATALYIDTKGFPVSGKTVNFTLRWPNGTNKISGTDITNSKGLANFSFDLNGTYYYGNWTIIADSGSLNDSTSFIYNWWGCGSGLAACNTQHDSGTTQFPPTQGGVSTRNSPYLNGWDSTTAQAGSHTGIGVNCTFCHQSFDGLPGGNTGTENLHLDKTRDVHRNISGGCQNASCHGSSTVHDSTPNGMTIGSCYNATCHALRTDISGKSTLNNSNRAIAHSEYSENNGTDFNGTFHTPDSTVPCIICHGPMHNITKPNETQRFIRNNNTEDSQCKTCHSSYKEHNSSNITSGGVNCTLCHSDDVHDIQVFAQNATYVDLNRNNPNPARGNCTNCHQNATFLASLKAQPKAGNYTGNAAPQIPKPMNHSTDPYSGALWNGTQSGYWTNTSQQSSCNYCHGNISLHNSSGLGNITKVLGTNSKQQSLTTGRWCANCHYKNAPQYAGTSFYPEPPEILNASGKVPAKSKDGTNFENHSSYVISGFNDSMCKDCHALVGTYGVNSANYSHSLDIGQGGGPNCTQCHDIGGSATGKIVNFSAMNDTLSIHSNLNSGVSTLLPQANKKCWACHGTGSEPASGHPAGYKSPSRCVDCHVTRQNLNYTPNNTLLNVTEHYWNGTDIDPSNATTCYSCHNKSEMMLSANDPDSGTGAVYGGANGGNNSSSHYGRKRTDYPAQDTRDYCNKCHNNQSTVFPFADNNNKTISNHSMNYPATNPQCKDCHSTGRIHNSTLQRPAITLQNSSYCLGCHGSGGTATINNLERHNGSAGLNCTQCHLNSTRSIHPVRYLQQDGISWQQTKSSPVNCTTCHQGSGLTNFSEATKIPKPMNHSTDPYSGALWNGTQSGYWTNTSQQSSCNYCHGNISLHNSSGLGNITKVVGTNSKQQSLTTGRWCANCHYKNAPQYAGTSFYPEPPEILNASGKLPSKARDGTAFENHSSYVISGFNDSVCKDCHALVGTYGITSANYSHSLDIGQGGGPNCTQCHDIGGSATGKIVNFSAMNDTLSIHSNLNSGISTLLPQANKKCWACHGTGSEPASGHPAGYKSPSRCVDCHVTRQNLNYTPNNTLLNVTEHYWNGTDIDPSNATTCYSCHNKSEMMLSANDPDSGTGAVYGGANGGNNSSSHYGRKRTDYPAQDTRDYCNKCHNNQSTVFPFADNNNKTISNHSMNYPATNPVCKDCHSTGRIHNSTLQRPAITLQNSSYCLGCHGSAGTATINNLERHNGSTGLNCTQCHLNSTRSIHPVRYLQQDGINWQQTKSSPVNCTTCHQAKLANFSDAPIIPDPLKHSNNLSNGTIWGTFWTTEQDSCYYCHNNTKHNATALGRINASRSDPSNIKNGSLTATAWCADCHYNDAVNAYYKGNLWNPAPPLITVNNTGKSNWENHSGYLGGGYKDSDCVTCHALNGSAYLSTSLNYSHSLNIGVNGGPNCTACHNIGGSAGPTRTVNFTAANNSLVVHSNLNSGVSTILPAGNKKCWACHGTGSQPGSGHPAKYKTPYACADCHVPGTGQNLNFTPSVITNVNQHYPGSVFMGTSKHSTNYAAGSCQVCHNNSLQYNNITANLNATVSHYATSASLPQTNISTSCGDACHNNSASIWGIPKQLADAKGHSYDKACQASCHNPYYKNATNVNSVNLHNASVGIRYDRCYAEGCHASRPGR